MAVTSLSAQEPPVQYIIPRGSNQLVTPAVSTALPWETIIEVRPAWAPRKTKLQRLRDCNGGTIPFVVVRSDREAFAIVSQEGDLLVLGHPTPMRIMLKPNQYTVTSDAGYPVITPTTKGSKLVTMTDKLTVTPQIPPWLPSDVLRSRTDYLEKETVFTPNRRIATGYGSRIEIGGISYKKYTIFFRDY